MDEKLIEFMKISGLNLYESKIYFSLLKHGAVTRSEIYKIAEVPQSRVYDIINSLIAKSLVKQADNQLIVPQHPRSIINSNSYLKNKERIIKTKQNMESQLEIINKKLSVLSDDKSIFCELEKMYDSPSTQHPVVKRFLSLFKNSQKEILCCTTLPILYPSGQFYKEVLSAVERGISYRRLLGYDYIMAQGEKSIIADSKKGIKIKAIAEDNIPEKYYVVDDSSVFLRAIKATLDLENEEAYIFNQKEIIGSYKESFEKLWNKGEILESFLKKLRAKIMCNKDYADILITIFEEGRTNKEDLVNRFGKSKIESLLQKNLLKNSEVKDVFILNVAKLLNQ